PTGLTASSITQTAATVSWDVVSGATSYDVDYKAASSGTWINAATATNATSVNLTSLTANTTYDWRVRTNCNSGISVDSTAQLTTATETGACPDPYDVGTNGSTGGAATISLNTDVNGLIQTRGGGEGYKFDVTAGTITLSLTGSPTLPADYQ